MDVLSAVKWISRRKIIRCGSRHRATGVSRNNTAKLTPDPVDIQRARCRLSWLEGVKRKEREKGDWLNTTNHGAYPMYQSSRGIIILGAWIVGISVLRPFLLSSQSTSALSTCHFYIAILGPSASSNVALFLHFRISPPNDPKYCILWIFIGKSNG